MNFSEESTKSCTSSHSPVRN